MCWRGGGGGWWARCNSSLVTRGEQRLWGFAYRELGVNGDCRVCLGTAFGPMSDGKRATQ